jgi:hypothetical protein
VSIRTFSKRRVAIIGATAAIALAGGGAAFAYFTATGNGTGHGTVGTAGTWTVAETSTSGTMYPGATSGSTLTFTVTNSGSGDQDITSLAAVVDSSTTPLGDIEVGPTPTPSAVASCAATWFTAAITSPTTLPSVTAPISLAPGASETVIVSVTMTNPSVNQDACESQLPDVQLNVN